jgi:hypothetical protein
LFDDGQGQGDDQIAQSETATTRRFGFAQIARAISSVSYSHQGWKTAAGNWLPHHLVIADEAGYWQVCQPV